MKEASDFGKRLKEERKKFGLTQTEIAKKCGVSGRMWGNYENGKYFPRNENLLAMQKAGIDIDYVMHGVHADITRPSENLPEYTAEEAELLTLFRQLSAPDRHVLKRQAQMLLAVAEQEKKADKKAPPAADKVG